MITEQIFNNDRTLNKTEKLNISLQDISKVIKQQLKKEYPLCKFSIRCEFYSMGRTLHIGILETNFKIVKPFEELSEVAILSYTAEDYTIEQLKALQEVTHRQICTIGANEVYNPNVWNNSVFLTEEGFKLIKRITELTNKFNWDNSDSQTDYFDVKFYTDLSIGTYDKPLKESI